MKPIISVILPVFNERENVESMLSAIRSYYHAELADDYGLEVIFVDDGSTDGSTEVLRYLARENDYTRLIVFSRNFGHQAAISAGYHYAVGDVVISMDSDLQHPVATIGDMLVRWREGYDVVYAVRDRETGSWLKGMLSRMFYLLFNWLSSTRILPGCADFRLVTREVVAALDRLPERCRFLRGLIPWLGFRSAEVTYVQQPRTRGEPKFRFFQSLGLGIAAFTGFSVAPLRAFVALGTSFLLVSVGYLCYALIDWLLGGPVVRGWPSLVALVVLTQGVTLIALGIQAEYLAKIVMEVKGRPEYIVREILGGDDAEGYEDAGLSETKKANGKRSHAGEDQRLATWLNE